MNFHPLSTLDTKSAAICLPREPFPICIHPCYASVDGDMEACICGEIQLLHGLKKHSSSR